MAEPILPGRPAGPHPTPEQLYRARRGLRTSEAERWLAHAAACATCSEELLRQEAFDAPEEVSPRRLETAWERFNEKVDREERAPMAPVIPFGSGSIRVPKATPATAVPRSRHRTPWMATLAAAAVAAAVGLGVWSQWSQWSSSQAPKIGPQPPAPVLRGSASASGDRRPSGLLDAPPEEIIFPIVPNAVGGEARRVMVFDAGHTYTWTSPPSADGRVPFPPSERQRLRKGVEYYWTVVGEEGVPARSFRLR
jgi:hypothetical protein